MNRGVRHKVQRSRRVALRADCAVLLARIMVRHYEQLSDREIREITEMRVRLNPPTGVKAPIVLTAYTKDQK